jgi:hypothetical protein
MKAKTYTVTDIVAEAKSCNNRRLSGLAMTAHQIEVAREAVKQGLLTEHFAWHLGFKSAPMFQHP